jgi:GntR family transcriptional repressor for pyruvate dehydrogenase complex
VFTLPQAAEIKRVSDEQHRAIATAIVNRDPVAAAGAAAAHVAHTERLLHVFLPPQ